MSNYFPEAIKRERIVTVLYLSLSIYICMYIYSPSPLHFGAGNSVGRSACDRALSELDYLIKETIESELDYVNDLRLCFNAYSIPLSAAFDVSMIFGGLSEIISIHDTFLANLSKVVDQNMDYRSILILFHDLLESIGPLYRDFCSHQSRSSRIFETKLASDFRFRQLVSECQKNLLRTIQQQQDSTQKGSSMCQVEPSSAMSRLMRNQNLPVASYIIKPMQRITKYYLLFERISKSVTICESNRDLKELAEKLKTTANSLCQTVNETCRAKEDLEDNQRKLRWSQNHIKQISSHELELDYRSSVMHSIRQTRETIFFEHKTNCLGDRKFIKAGNMFKWRSGRELALFLFNDVLLITINKTATLARLDDIFSSEKAQQSYYKLYKPPILVENIVVLQESIGDISMDSQASRSSWSEKQLLSLSFSDKSTGEIFNLLANSSAEKDHWMTALNYLSIKAREARRHQQQTYMETGIIYKPVPDQAYGRLLVTVHEVKYCSKDKGSRRSSLELDDRSIQQSPFSWRVSVHLQLRRSKMLGLFDSDDAVKAIVNISDIFRTNPTPFNIYYSSMQDEVKARYTDESTQFLLPKKLLDDGRDYLDIEVVDESAFREINLIGKRRIDLDQLMGSGLSQSPDFSGGSTKTIPKLVPERPIELSFKLRLAKDKCETSRQSLSNLDYRQNSIKGIRQDKELSLRMRFHLHLFQ